MKASCFVLMDPMKVDESPLSFQPRNVSEGKSALLSAKNQHLQLRFR